MHTAIPQDATVRAYHDAARHSQSWLVLRVNQRVIGGRRLDAGHYDTSYPGAIREAERLTADRQALERFFRNFTPVQQLPPLQEWDSSLFL